jgi:hypothetical protein
VEAATHDADLFCAGKPSEAEPEPGLGKKLIESLAVNVIEKDAAERERARAHGRLRLAHGKKKEDANRLV